MLDSTFASVFGTADSLVGAVSTADFLLCCVFAVVVAVVNLLFVLTPFGKPRESGKTLRITILEDLEYAGVFDRVPDRYATEPELTEVTTTNMGSLFQLTYQLRMREPGLEKAMIDELRCLNGNLKISLGMTPAGRETL